MSPGEPSLHAAYNTSLEGPLKSCPALCSAWLAVEACQALAPTEVRSQLTFLPLHWSKQLSLFSTVLCTMQQLVGGSVQLFCAVLSTGCVGLPSVGTHRGEVTVRLESFCRCTGLSICHYSGRVVSCFHAAALCSYMTLCLAWLAVKASQALSPTEASPAQRI